MFDQRSWAWYPLRPPCFFFFFSSACMKAMAPITTRHMHSAMPRLPRTQATTWRFGGGGGGGGDGGDGGDGGNGDSSAGVTVVIPYVRPHIDVLYRALRMARGRARLSAHHARTRAPRGKLAEQPWLRA